jgi:hypothetical protein
VLSYALPIPASFVIGTGAALAVPWSLAYYRSGNAVRVRDLKRLGWGWRGALPNAAFAALLGAAWYLASAAALWHFIWDEPEDHWINIATIAAGNFYPHLAFAPDQPLQYHYGFDLLAAVFHRLSGLPIWWSIDAITVQFAPMLVWLAIAVAWLLTMNHAASLLTGALFFFGGGLRVTLLANAIREWVTHPSGFWAAVHETPPPLNDIYDPLVWGVHDHNRALATVAILAIVTGLIELLQRPTTLQAVIIGVLIGLTALVSETDFVLVTCAVASLMVFTLLGRRRGRSGA